MPVQEARKICFQRGLGGSGVTAKGFSDVSILTGNVEAAGHGIFVDEKSVAGALELLDGQTMPGYLTHEGAIYSDRLTKEIGIFSGFYRDGMKLKASTFTFLNSFIKHSPEEYDSLVEMAQKLPDQFGLSVVFSGTTVWPMPDGSEVECDDAPEGCNAAMPSVRFNSIESADFVKAPAANPAGLFSVDGKTQGMANETILLSKHQEALAAKETEVTSALAAKHQTALAEKDAALVAALAAKDTEHKTALAAALAEQDKTHKALLTAKEAELAEAKKFDIRLSGGTQGIITALGASSGSVVVMPEPAHSDNDRWNQFTELEKKDKALAAEFKKKYLVR